MTTILNPRIELQIIGDETIVINDRGQDSSLDLYIDFDIDKDLDEESNEATLTIHNLSDTTRAKLVDSTNQYAPIEIYLTPYTSTEHVLAFKGEIETVKNKFMRPGHETSIVCTSQNENHRSFYFGKTYSKGTTIEDILNDMIAEINLPKGDISTLPSDKILFGESFSGPAFPILRRYAHDLGYYAYVLDGTLNLTDLYEHPSPTNHEITSDQLLSSPEETTRIDRAKIDIKTSALFRNVSANAKRIKYKKALKQIKQFGGSEYVEYEAVDKIIEGLDFEIFLQPDINPDNIVEYNNTKYRVQSVSHYGNNYAGDWTTSIESDFYSGEE